MTAEKHITLVAVLHLVHSGLGILLAIFLFTLLTGIGALSGEEDAFLVLGIIGTSLSVFLFFISIPGIIGGVALLQHARWSRVFMIIIGALKLLDIPLGTALGIYTMIALMRDDVIRVFEPLPSTVPSPVG
jgi:hypothetical protein